MEKTFLQKYLPEFVYGSIDGTVTTFAIVAGAMGASLSPGVVFVLGMANVLADGFSMASGNYLSEKSAKAVDQSVGIDEDRKLPSKTALATFISFVLIGLIPLIPFLFAIINPAIIDTVFLISIIITVFAFLAIGIFRGKVSGEKLWISSLETLGIGVIAAGISFLVGYLLRGLA